MTWDREVVKRSGTSTNPMAGISNTTFPYRVVKCHLFRSVQ